MSFRARLTLVAAAAVALAIVAASAVVYVVVREKLRSPIDHSLRGAAREIRHFPPSEVGHALFELRGQLGGASGYPQVVFRDGRTLRPPPAPPRGERDKRPTDVALPVTRRVLAVAREGESDYLTDTTVRGVHVRMITFSYAPGIAVQVARPLTEVDDTLHTITIWLIAIAGGGIALAAALGLGVSRAALAPVRRLTTTTEKVTETRDLGERIDIRGRDELSRLAESFNTMLGALEESTLAQRQLVADASHELRTPLTSLRTNIEVLASDRTLPPGERGRLLHDVVEQLGEMTTLVAELIDLARGEQHAAEPEDVRLDLVTQDAVARVQRDRPGVSFETDLHESLVRGVPANLERAISNLLDNAAKWSPAGGAVEVAVRAAEVTVRDHGPGIDDEDLPYVFDRFYRARSARGLPGSGLGLAIVRQVAEAHGGTVVAERAHDGGTRMRLRLPVS